MSKFTHEHREQFITIFSFVVSIVSVLAVCTLIGLEAYVRWTINKEFTFLGGNGLSALILASFGLTAILLFTHRSRKE